MVKNTRTDRHSRARGPHTKRIGVRFINRGDLPTVCEIERQSFHEAWEEKHFLYCLRQPKVIGFVAIDGPEIVGYAICELLRNSVEILNLAVRPEWCRIGIGRAILDYISAQPMTTRREFMAVDIRETNLDGQKFFSACGFFAGQVLRGFYSDVEPVEDAYRMTRDL